MRDLVFISYSHSDAAWLNRLQVYLAPLEQRGRVRRWDDTLIAPGRLWEREIATALESTRIAILLVSAKFLASDFISRVELPQLLGAAENQGVLIIPVVLDHCNFERYPEIAQFQSINSPARPLETLDEPACKAVFARLAAAVDDAFGESGTIQPAVAAARLVTLPARNPLFCGRDDLFENLTAALERAGRAALCGLPGLGKTEAAIEFAYRRRKRYQWVLWSRADSEQQLIGGYCAIAAAFGLPEAKGTDQLAAAAAARTALASRVGCLLILDAVEDLDLVRDWLPAGDATHTLLTARSANLGGLAESIEIEPLPEADAVGFLLRRARLDATADPQAREAAKAVAQAAAGVPLALDQAGAYVEETGCSLQEYSQLWRDHRRQLLAERGQGSLRADTSLSQAWSLSFEQLQRASPAAAAVLRLIAFCHFDALPESVLNHPGARLSPAPAAWADPLARNAVFREAQRFAFLRRDAKTRHLNMHRLVQQFIRDSLADDARREACAQALQLIDTAFPRPRFVNWAECDALASHALSVLEHAETAGIVSGPGTRLALELGYYFSQRARYAEAKRLIGQALSRQRTANDHEALARGLLIDGHHQLACGRHADAIARLTEAAALLADRPVLDLVTIYDLLGVSELACNRFDTAETWLSRAQITAETLSAQRTIEAAQYTNDFGALYFRRGDLARARDAFERAAAMRRELLPANHPGIAQSLNNLAAVCVRQGEREAARASYLEALGLREAALGPDHPEVAESLVSLGLLELKSRDFVAARAAVSRALQIQQQSRGSIHPDLAKAQACMGDVALAEGQLDEAQNWYREAHDMRVSLFGAYHPDSARALLGLGDVARARGDWVAAAAAFGQALQVLEAKLGRNHPEVRICEADLRQARGHHSNTSASLMQAPQQP